MRYVMAATILAMSAQPALADAASEDAAFNRAVAAVEARIAPIDAIDGVIPGRAIVMVKAGEKPIIDVRGVTRADGGGRAVDADTPFYIASMTKAFVGLMAIRLDETGVMSLDATLAEYFPAMKVDGVDMGTITMRRLLSHQLGFRAPTLNIRTAYTDLVPVRDYAAIVSAVGETIDEPFRYDNLGYLLYAAALEQRTGRSWRSWIDDVVFDPLSMQHSSARTSDFAEVSHLHVRTATGLQRYAPKSDAIMHAAGGLVLSAGDMARWLTANVGGQSAIPAQSFATAHSQQVAIDRKQGPVTCTGYAFGWQKCAAMGISFLEHGGGYTGMRAEMVIIPEHNVGFAAIFNSDSMTGGLSGQLMQTFLAAYAGNQDTLPPPDAFAARYGEMVAQLSEGRGKEAAGERAKPAWGGWTWTPDITALAEISGTYRHRAYGDLHLAVERGRLVGTLNGTAMTLEPATKDIFGATLATDSELETLTVQRDDNGAVTAITFLDSTFETASD